jgi:hypothetical protein
MLSVGTIVGGGFRLLRERPGAVLVWGLLYFAAIAAIGLVVQPLVATQATSMNGDPAAALAAMQGMIGQLLLLYLIYLVLFVMLMAASQRAVLRPEESGFAYLRLGMDELRLIALAIFLFIIFYVGLLVVGVVMGLFMGVIMVTAGPGAFAITMIVYGCVVLAAACWFEVRFSLAFPLTLLRRRIVIGESWRATRGHFWTLFGGYFVIAIIITALWLAVLSVTMGPYISELMRSGFKPEAVRAAMQHQMARQAGGLDATMIIGWGLSALVGALGLALFGGAIATAAGELTMDRAGMAQTFG